MGVAYFFLAFFACVVGAMTGMGGGVFIKPILDMIGQFDVSSANMLSSLTVFCMAVVSVARQCRSKERPTASAAVSLAVGAVAGGGLGSGLFSLLAARADPGAVKLTQNAVLALLVVLIFVYMREKDKIRSPEWTGIVPSALVGLVLGVISSFLGIGGGPLNVCLIVLCFGYSTKKAALSSLIIILFSQAAKIGPALAAGELAGYDLRALPFMAVGAVAGGLAGSAVSCRISEKTADKLFAAAQALVFAICIVNILRSGMLFQRMA